MFSRALCCLVVAVLSVSGCVSLAPQPTESVVPKYSVYEIVLNTDEAFANPFWDPAVSAEFKSPSGKISTVEGFYFGGKEWRIRFVPREEGLWSYKATLRGRQKSVTNEGQFTCRGQSGDGFLRVSSRNCYRMEYDTGRSFVGIGIQTCGAVKNVDFDGPADGNWRTVSVEEWCNAFKGAVSLHRINLSASLKTGCAVPLIPDLNQPDRYNLDTCRDLDRMYSLHRAAGFAEIAILFQDMSAYANDRDAFGVGRDTRDYKNVHAANFPLQAKYLRYVVNRFGCYVDIWELFNEDAYAPDDYLALLHKTIRNADPYRHIITTNFERPDRDFCEIIAPHEYVSIPAQEVDAELTKQFAAMKSYGKPVQYTEFGNKGTLPNVDPIKWRVAVWTSFMNESGMLFWGMSGRKVRLSPNSNSNAYIGPDSRQHFRVLLDFARDLPIDVRPKYSNDSPEFQFRSYTLSNSATSVVYLHRRGGYEGQTREQQFRVQTGPGRFTVKWINPEDGKTVGAPRETSTLNQFLYVKVPAFSVDLACRIDRIDSPLPPAPQPTASATVPAPTIAAGWKVAWIADLNNPKSADQWLTTAGSITTGGGVLCLRSEEAGEGETTLAVPTFPDSVRVEYVGYLNGENSGDLTTILNANASGSSSGYTFQFAGRARTLTRILRASKPLDGENKDLSFEVGRAYRIAIERDGATLRLFVDGRKLLEAVDPQPLAGHDLDRIGFYTFDGALCIKELRVLVKAP